MIMLRKKTCITVMSLLEVPSLIEAPPPPQVSLYIATD